MSEIKWIKTSDELPAIGEAVLLMCYGCAQNITYFLSPYDCADSCKWFPFANDDDYSIPFKDATHWMYVKGLSMTESE